MQVNIVLAVGFSVDYAAHIAEAFSSNSDAAIRLYGSDEMSLNVKRATLALHELGSSVMNGGLSTLVVIAHQNHSNMQCGAINFAFPNQIATMVLFSSTYEGYQGQKIQLARYFHVTLIHLSVSLVMAAMFFGFVAFGLLHGLVLLPVLLILTADAQNKLSAETTSVT